MNDNGHMTETKGTALSAQTNPNTATIARSLIQLDSIKAVFQSTLTRGLKAFCVAEFDTYLSCWTHSQLQLRCGC